MEQNKKNGKQSSQTNIPINTVQGGSKKKKNWQKFDDTGLSSEIQRKNVSGSGQKQGAQPDIKQTQQQSARGQQQQTPRVEPRFFTPRENPQSKHDKPQPSKSRQNPLSDSRSQPNINPTHQQSAWGQPKQSSRGEPQNLQSKQSMNIPPQKSPFEGQQSVPLENKKGQQNSQYAQGERQHSPRGEPQQYKSRQNVLSDSSSQPQIRQTQQSARGQPQQSHRGELQNIQTQQSMNIPPQKKGRQNPLYGQGEPQQSPSGELQKSKSRQNVPSDSRSQPQIRQTQQSAWGQPQQSPRGELQNLQFQQQSMNIPPQKFPLEGQHNVPLENKKGRQNPQYGQCEPQQSPRGEPQQSKSTQNVPSDSRSQPQIRQTQQQSAWGQPQQSLRGDQNLQTQQQSMNIPPQKSTLEGQQSIPLENKTSGNKYPKQSEQAVQQQAANPSSGSVTQIQPQSSTKEQQISAPKPIQTQELLAVQMQQKAVITPPLSARKSKGGFQPLEVAAGSCVGGRGQKLKIEANYLRIQIDRLVPKAYHYDIRFDPEKIPKKHLPDVVEKFRLKFFANYFIAFDGKNNVYSASPLPINSNALKDEMLWHDNQTNRDRIITITIKEVDTCVIDLSAIKKYADKSPGIIKPLRAIQCLEIVLRMPVSGKFVNVNRSFFTRPNKTIDLGENYELWTGLYQSVVIGDVPLFNIDVVNKPFPSARNVLGDVPLFNIDVVNKPFPSARNVLNILTDVMNINVNQPLQYPQQLHDYLKGLTLVYKQPGTTFSNIFKYNGLKDSAKTQTFVIENRKLTVEMYFREKNTPIKYPHLPCLWCGPAIKNIYLPLEFCSIQDGQVIRKVLSENQIRTVIAETATSTDVRKRRIMDLLDKIRHNESKVVKEFGISIGDKFTEIEARILTAPALEYLSNPEVKVDRGVWNAEREKFLDGKQCIHWSVLKLDDRCPNSDIFKLAEMIFEIGRKANMSFAPKFTDLIEMRSNSRRQDIEAKMLPLKRKNVELLFVIIPNRNEAYPNVKQAAELKCGILTQCIKSFTLARKLNGSTVYNILLKLNSKLNGLNHKVPLKFTPPIARSKVMIVGADVTHPSGTMNEPSAVGVASSHDINALRYSMCWRIQNPTQEIITDLKNIMVEQLNFYKKSMNNELPDKILYYRDGVSDGQFDDVLNVELAAIYMACQQMAPAYKPAVTFIVVQKRHNTRFYPGASRVSCGKNNNVMPGTIVDKFIIDPRQYQFFLVSHAAIQGVAKPTKYCVIWDDSNIKADELQALTYNLCHVFTRCNRSVSYVAPTYYAHLAAYRGKVYIQNERINMDNLEQEFNQRQIREEVCKGHPMFFV